MGYEQWRKLAIPSCDFEVENIKTTSTRQLGRVDFEAPCGAWRLARVFLSGKSDSGIVGFFLSFTSL